MGPRRHVEVVGDDDEGRVVLGGDGLQQGHDGAPRLRVERPGRFVGEDDARPAHEGARDGDALLLAARHLSRVGVEPIAEADALEHVRRESPALPEGRARGVEHRHFHVLEGGPGVEDVELLEHEAEGVAAQARAPSFAQGLHVLPLDRVGALVGQVEEPDDVEHGRLAGSGAPDDGDVIARVDLEIHAAQDPQIRAVGELDRSGHPLKMDERHFRRPLPSLPLRRPCPSSRTPSPRSRSSG